MTFTYGAVDDSSDPAEAVTWQERVNDWPAIRAYKERTYELLADAERILDLGCGPGTDAVGLGSQRAIGVDRSTMMCRRAAARGVKLCCGDALALPFHDDAFDGCRADRVMQHLSQPARALRELVRVTRRGGRLVVADPDQESLTIHVPGVSPTLIDRVKQLRRDVGYRNGRLVGELPGRFAALGLVDIEVTAHPLLLTDPHDAFGLPRWPHHWHAQGIGGWTEDELVEWERAIDCIDGDEDGFVFALLYFVVTAWLP